MKFITYLSNCIILSLSVNLTNSKKFSLNMLEPPLLKYREDFLLFRTYTSAATHVRRAYTRRYRGRVTRATSWFVVDSAALNQPELCAD